MLRHSRCEEKFQLNYVSCAPRVDHIRAEAAASYSNRQRLPTATRQPAGGAANQPFFTITWRTTV